MKTRTFMQAVLRFFQPPVFQNENDTHSARVLFWCFNVTWAAIVGYMLYVLASPGNRRMALLALPFLIFVFGLMAVAHGRHVAAVADVFLLVLFTLIASLSFIVGSGVDTVGYAAGTMAVLIIAGLVRGPKFLGFLSALVVAITLSMGYAEVAGVKPAPLLQRDPLVWTWAAVGIMAYSSLMLGFSAYSLRRARGQYRKEWLERERAERDVQKQASNLELVHKLSVALAQAGPEEDIFGLMTECVRAALDAPAAGISTYDASTRNMVLQSLSVRAGLLASIQQMLGNRLDHFQVTIDPADYAQMIAVDYKKFMSIADLTFGVIPDLLGKMIQVTLGIEAIYTCVLHQEGAMLGTFTIYCAADTEELNESMVKALAHVISIAISRKQAEAELSQSEDRFRSIVSSGSDLILVVDANGIVKYESPSADRLTGYPSGSWIGKSVLSMLHPEDVAVAQRKFQDTLVETGETLIGPPQELRVCREDGTYIFFDVVAMNLLNRASVNGIVITARDINERKRTENELKRLNRALKATSACNLALVRAENETELAHEICRILVEEGGYQLTWIAFLDPDQANPLKLVAEYGASTKERSFLSTSLDSKQQIVNYISNPPPGLHLLVVNDVRSSPELKDWCGELLESGIQSLIGFTLKLDNEPIGILFIFAAEVGTFADFSEVSLLAEMTYDLSFGIHTLRVRKENQRNQQLVVESKASLEAAYDATLKGWAQALELREHETGEHSQRVVDLTQALAKACGVPEEELVHYRRGALLHDIGKMGTPDHILNKPGDLVPEEWVEMRKHPVYAVYLLNQSPYLKPALTIPQFHHERWNGSGYPSGLKGEQIPLAARIFAVVDVWDALTHQRAYRTAWSVESTSRYLEEQAGILFDPAVVKEFLKLCEEQPDIL
jgi:PAS domain S-box-containing protein/putative nucleotidyltransferase with HDIG domain